MARRRKLHVDDVTVVQDTVLKRAVAAAALGNAMEWYDFGVYAYIATTISKIFFPDTSGGLGLLATFGAFTASFLVRPIGGAFFGRLGDKIGRQKVLATTMLIMAVGTLAIGFIPGYDTLGFWSPILLLLARLVQGFSTGGEYAGATTFVAEYSTDKRRGFMSSWLDVGTLVGYTLGALIVTGLTTFMSTDVLQSWGWRIPFLVAGPLGAIGLYVRLKLEETPAFQQVQEAAAERESVKVPFKDLFIGYWRPLLICVGLVLTFNVTDYMLLTYMPTYLTGTLGANATHGLLLIVVVMLVMICLTTFGGRLSDRIGRKPILLVGCIGLFVLSWPALKLIQIDNIGLRFLGLLIIGMLLMSFSSTMPATLPALFPTVVRYSAVAIAFNVSVSLFGGTTPFFTQALLNWGDNANWALARDIPAFYLMAGAAIGILTLLPYKETAGQPLLRATPAVDTKPAAHAAAEEYKDPNSDLSQTDWGQDYAQSDPHEWTTAKSESGSGSDGNASPDSRDADSGGPAGAGPDAGHAGADGSASSGPAEKPED